MKLAWRGDWFDWLMVQVVAICLSVGVLASGVALSNEPPLHPETGQPAELWHRAATPAEELAWQEKRDADIRTAGQPARMGW